MRVPPPKKRQKKRHESKRIKGEEMKPQRYFFLILFGACVIGFYVLWPSFHTKDSRQGIATTKQGQSYGTPQIGGSFHLVDHHGVARNEADFKGKILLVYFGYSFCPDICPGALYHISQALAGMGKAAQEFQPIFITVDPERDTTSHLTVYMENYHPQFVALTGSQEQIQQAMRAYHVFAQKVAPDGTSTDYLIDHSSVVYVMDRQGRFITSFNHQTEPDKIKEILKNCL
jgi:cytochrome oxidase Cu insertion factor (SCO1/SenC/PrrC family)